MTRIFVNSVFDIPPFAIYEYFDTDELVTLRRTHRFFASKLCPIGSPIIHLRSDTSASKSEYAKIPIQFPKAKLIVEKHGGIHPTILLNVTSLNVSYLTHLIDLSLMTNLTSLKLMESDYVRSEMLDNLTKLVELALDSTPCIKGPTVRKLTNLQTLNLDMNDTITDADIASLPIRSLSLLHNTTITPLVLKQLNLTHLNITHAMPALADELLHCLQLTDLELDMNTIIKIGLETIRKIPSLRKLTIDEFVQTPRIDAMKYLTHLTYLNFKNIKANLDHTPFPLLQTLIITGVAPSILYFPSVPLDNLTHLEINNYANLIVDYLKNLTYLDICVPRLPSNRELHRFGKLKKVILRGDGYRRPIDISQLTSVESLEIIGSDASFSVYGRNESLESLTIDTPRNTPLDDNSIQLFPNLKYLSLGPQCPKVTGSCFKHLPKLFSLSINERNSLDPKHILALIKRGVLIKYKN
ncbi:MAG: hypothetical protein Hyperionvirus1_210 [Hyperionvirus sp.]|uniref:Leucine-rich repeat protein n=1 Tax=Hyperionvirus sp. TaxID=2487770 RepID=A0A3G5A8Y0_9VIRU|nr:MAG: hypothetical protein Hyperionvirus1_210 [Hyperionvirus sp.]